MNVSDQIIAVIDSLCEKFGVAVDWTSETVLPYVEQLCQRYIKYEIITSIAGIVLMLTLCVVSFVVSKLLCKKAAEDDWDDCCASYWFASIGVAALIAIGIVAIIVICCQCHDIITCMTFPEKQIFEYVQSLIVT